MFSGGAGRGDMIPSASSGYAQDDFIPEDEAEESFSERIIGLSEMFPESMRNNAGKIIDLSCRGVKKLYSLSRDWTWMLFASALIAVAPPLLEAERFQMEEMQKMQQRQMLLGPNVARS